MKKLLISLFLLLPVIIIANCYCQPYHPYYVHKNAISLVFQPTDFGVGLRYDYQINEYGLYGSASWGNYRFENNGRLYNHVKTSLGIVRYVPFFRDPTMMNFFSAALNCQHYGQENATCPSLSRRTLFPLSIDIGTGMKINRINVGFCFDFVKQEGLLNFGMNF